VKIVTLNLLYNQFYISYVNIEINSTYLSGDEILSINGTILQGMSHRQAISVFKNIREGYVSLHIARRQNPPFGKRKQKRYSCEELEVVQE